jgi:hypothetical protein
MSKLAKRLDAHFVACAAAAGAAAVGVQSAEAGIVHSGPVNIVIPDTIDGVYMNVVTGAVTTTSPGPSGWDINPYSASAAGTSFNLWGPSVNTWFSTTGNVPAGSGFILPAGTPISGAAAAFFRPGGVAAPGTSGLTFNSSNNLLGFRFVNEANANLVHFGWVRIAFGATIGDRAIVEYAYENVADTAINAGAVPAPGSLALLALGALGVAGRRRK